MPTKNPPALLPVLSCLIAATLWGVMWYPLRLLETWGLAGCWASLIIYAAALLPLLPALHAQRHGLVSQWRILSIVGISAGWANLGFILAVLEGNVVRVLLLFYLSPVWTVLLGKFFLKEHLSAVAWLSMFMALLGAVIMLWQPELGLPLPESGADLLAISAGFAFAVLNVFIRKAGDVPIVLKMGSSSAGVMLLSVAGIVIVQPGLPELSSAALILALILGSAGIIIMTYTAQYGVTHLPVHRSAVIFLFEIVAGALSAALLTEEIVTAREWAGGVLVVLAAWITALDTLQPAVFSKKGRT